MAEAIYQLLLKISGEIFLVKMYSGTFQGVYVLGIRTKSFKSNLVLDVILVL